MLFTENIGGNYMVIFIGSIIVMLSMNDLNASFLGRWSISGMFFIHL